MAEIERKRLPDGFDTLLLGVNEGLSASLLPRNQAARLTNVTVRGGYATCRPSFVKFPLQFQDQEQTDWWKQHNVQGRGVYRSPVGVPSLIYSVGGRIFKVDVNKPRNTNVIELTPVGDWNPSNRPHAWMLQLGNTKYFVIQDGQSIPLIYDGATCRRASLGFPQYEVPVGTAMAYGLGRLAVVRPHRKSYVIGDIVNGGTEVIQFTEDNYLNEGGDITVPIDGEINALAITSQIDRSVGQGELVAFTQYGAASARIGELRTTWKDIQFQYVALIGSGATSHNSVTLVNGDLFFRAPEGFRSVAMTRSEFQGAWGRTPISREVNLTLSYDTDHLLGFCESALFDNRLLMLCNQTPLTNGCYHRGIIALDFDLISSMGAKAPPAYDGLWMGFNFTSIVSGDFNNGERCFVTHRNDDGENELWELQKEGYLDNGVNRIQWAIEGPALIRSDIQNMSLKSLETGDISLDGIIGEVDWRVQFKSDQSPCFLDWADGRFCAKSKSCDAGCEQVITYQPQYRTKIRFPQPPDTCSPSDNKPARLGYEFQTRYVFTGKATLNAARIAAIEQREDLGLMEDCGSE